MNFLKVFTTNIILLVSINAIGQKNKAAVFTQDIPKDKVTAEIARLSIFSGGVVGLDAIHVETGKRVVQNDLDAFPMASSYKIPIAIELLNKVDSGKYTIDQLIEIQKSDLHP